MSTIFISYRRDDSSYPSQALAWGLMTRFPDHEIFMDTESIRVGKDIGQVIGEALDRAAVLIAVVGSQWLTLTDANGRIRLHQPDDWVASEIRHFLVAGKPIIPITVGDANPLISVSAVPDAIERFAGLRSIPLRTDSGGDDLDKLAIELVRLGITKRAPEDFRLPTPDERKRRINSFTDEELSRHLATLESWHRVQFKPPKADVETGTAIVRNFEFASFRDAMHFMATAERFVNQLDHHPMWQNAWRTVTVRLTTFDIGFKPSIYDLTVARYLNGLFVQYQPGNATSASEKLLAEALGLLSH